MTYETKLHATTANYAAAFLLAEQSKINRAGSEKPTNFQENGTKVLLTHDMSHTPEINL